LGESLFTATKSGQQYIDEASALFVASIEGQSTGGNPDLSGKLLYSLGKDTCDEFDKCESYDDAASNEFILVSLRDMKRLIKSGDCSSAERILKDVESMLPVPLIQGTLSLAIKNEKLAWSINESLDWSGC
jgi:Iap family predicted aminopeptidase